MYGFSKAVWGGKTRRRGSSATFATVNATESLLPGWTKANNNDGCSLPLPCVFEKKTAKNTKYIIAKKGFGLCLLLKWRKKDRKEN